MKSIWYYLRHPLVTLIKLDENRIITLNDKLYLKLKFKQRMKYSLNLNNPKTFNEKMQWLKVNDRKDIYTTLADKYEVKKYVSKLIGNEYVIPLLGVYDKFDDIDFEKLPNQFVIKCTHNSGGVLVVKDKKDIDFEEAKKLFANSDEIRGQLLTEISLAQVIYALGDKAKADKIYFAAVTRAQKENLHTYLENGTVLPPFSGEPEAVALPETADEAADILWQALDENNRISLFVRYVDLATGRAEDRLINKNQ